MRSTTKTIVGLASLGVLAASYKFGLEAPAAFANANATTLTGSGSTSSLTDGTSSLGQTDATGSTSSDTNTGSSSSSGSSSGSNGSSSSSSNGSSSSSSGSSNSSSGSASSTTVTKTGDAIQYRYGTVQVSVTKVDGKITDVTLIEAGATGGRAAAFPYLVDYAIQAQGTNFSNLSGATYTTDAFIQSMDSALAQF